MGREDLRGALCREIERRDIVFDREGEALGSIEL